MKGGYITSLALCQKSHSNLVFSCGLIGINHLAAWCLLFDPLNTSSHSWEDSLPYQLRICRRSQPPAPRDVRRIWCGTSWDLSGGLSTWGTRPIQELHPSAAKATVIGTFKITSLLLMSNMELCITLESPEHIKVDALQSSVHKATSTLKVLKFFYDQCSAWS